MILKENERAAKREEYETKKGEMSTSFGIYDHQLCACD